MPRNQLKITHMSKFSSSSSHFSIALPIFAFICFPNPASFGWTLYDFLGVAKWWHWSPFCTFHESPSLVEIQHCQQIIITFSLGEVPIPGINVLFTHSWYNWLSIQAEVFSTHQHHDYIGISPHLTRFLCFGTQFQVLHVALSLPVSPVTS